MPCQNWSLNWGSGLWQRAVIDYGVLVEWWLAGEEKVEKLLKPGSFIILIIISLKETSWFVIFLLYCWDDSVMNGHTAQMRIAMQTNFGEEISAWETEMEMR